MLAIIALTTSSFGANPDFPETRVCEWPTSVGYGTWTGDVVDPAGNTSEHVRSACSAVLVHERVLVTAAHCLDPDFQFGVFDEVARFGNHIEDNGIQAEVDIEFCEPHPSGYSSSDGRYAGPDIAVCILSEPAPYASPTAILVPASCENDYIRNLAFEQASAHLNTAYPNSPYGFGMAPVPVTAVGYGFETRGSDSAGLACSLVYEDCPAGNRRAAPSYAYHELYQTIGGDAEAGEPDAIATRMVPYLHRRHNTSYVPELSAWDTWVWPDSVAEHGVLRGGDSGGPMLFEMADGTWRVIGIASWGGSNYSVQEWDTLNGTPEVNNVGYGYTAFASLPVYLPWVESVVDDALGVDLTPCHTLESTNGEARYTYSWTNACEDAVSHYGTSPDTNLSLFSGGCAGSEGGDDFWLTRECAGWDGSSSLASTPAPTQGELLLGLAAAADPPQTTTLFDLAPTWEVFGTGGADRFEIELTEPHTSFPLGAGDDWLTAKGEGTMEVEVLAGDGDDTITLYGETADLVFPGPGRDEVSTGDGDDVVVVLGGCELEVGETFDGGEGHDLLIAPTDACDLAKRGIYALNFEAFEATSPRAEDRVCGQVGDLPPVISAPTREQQEVIDELCFSEKRSIDPWFTK